MKVVYDIERIMDCICAKDVVNYFGIESVCRGEKTYISCPGHFARLGKEDQRLGNCVVLEYGYYCFACSEFVGILDMICEIDGCNKFRAIQIAGDIAGGIEHFILEGEDFEQDHRAFLRRDELQFLGLDLKKKPSYIPKATYEEKDRVIKHHYCPRQREHEGEEIDFMTERVRCKKYRFPTMNQLKEDEYDVYVMLVRQKCKEKAEFYADMIKKYVYGAIELPSVVQKESLYQYYAGQIRKCYELFLRFENQ